MEFAGARLEKNDDLRRRTVSARLAWLAVATQNLAAHAQALHPHPSAKNVHPGLVGHVKQELEHATRP